MNRKFKKLRKDNNGVTLILAIVAVAFVGILAAAIVSATMTNYKLKMMDRYTKEAFYSADSVVEELHTGIGIKCFDALADAYEYTASNLLYQQTFDGSVMLAQKTNAEANSAMKLRYKYDMGKEIFGEGMVITDRDKVMEFLNSFITKPESAKVINYTNVIDRPDVFGYTIEDVTIEYKKNSGNPYFSTVTVDVDIRYPDIEIDFISDKKELKTYLDYCLIGMDSIGIGYDEVTKGFATISGGAYAGDNGLDIHAGSRFLLNDDLMVGSQLKVPTVLVTGGDIKLLPGNTDAVLQVGSADVWCNNITIGKETSGGKVIYTSTDARTYVADDLTLEGTGCNVTIKGTYLGFGSNNSNTYSSNKNSSTSSAIIVNGRNCSLDLTGIKTLLLAGKAYVNLGEDQEYMTGDSLAVKGNQEIYLVPATYLDKINEAADPINIANPSLDASDVKVDLTNFFAKRLGLLSENGYVIRKDKDGKSYFYLEFASRDAQNEYVKCVIQDGYLEGLFRSKGVSYETGDLVEKNAIASTIDMGIARFFDGNTEIKLSNAANVSTSGTLLQVTKGNGLPNMSIYNPNMGYDTVVGMSTSTANKYKIIKSYLDFEEDASYVPFPSKIVIDGGTYDVDENNLTNIYDITVDKEKLSKLDTNIIHNENGTIAAVITSKDLSTSSTYTIPVGVNNGVVLGYGVDIVVNHAFEGLIITDGKITVIGDTAVTTGIDNRAELTLDVYHDVAEYFYIFQETSNTHQLDDINIKDVLEFSNWRKNENVYENTN